MSPSSPPPLLLLCALCSDVEFAHNGFAVVFYLLWLLYFCLGALQVHYGYPTTPPRESLTHSGVKPPISLLYSIFTAIPFLPELKWVRLPLGVCLMLMCIRHPMFCQQPDSTVWGWVTDVVRFWIGYAQQLRSTCLCGSSWSKYGWTCSRTSSSRRIDSATKR